MGPIYACRTFCKLTKCVVSHRFPNIYGWMTMPMSSIVTFTSKANTLALDVLLKVSSSFSKILSTITWVCSSFALVQYPHSHFRWSNWHSLYRYWHQQKYLHMQIGAWVQQDLLLRHHPPHYSRVTNGYIFALHYIFLIFLFSCGNMDFYLNVPWRCFSNC